MGVPPGDSTLCPSGGLPVPGYPDRSVVPHPHSCTEVSDYRAASGGKGHRISIQAVA